jgi:RHS repeat-associated protein
LGAGYQEYVATPHMLSAVVLPNGTSWQFSYDSYGNVTVVALPTGGNITYQHTLRSDNCVGGAYVPGPWSRVVFDGTHSSTWQYSVGIPASNTVTDPMGNNIVYTSSCSPYVHIDKIQYYSGGASPSNLLKTVSETNGAVQDPLAASGSVLFPQGDTTTLPNNQVSQTWIGYAYSFTYKDPVGNTYTVPFNVPTYLEDWDWGNGSAGPVLSGKTTARYAWNDSRYLTANLLDLVYWQAVQGPGNTYCSETTYAYDGSSVVSSGVSQQLLPAPGAVRGNVSSSAVSLFNPCQSSPTPTLLTSYYTSYDTGMVSTITDPKGKTTTLGYAAWGGWGEWYQSRVYSITNALGQTTRFGYDWPSGLLVYSQDPNNNATGYVYDAMFRLTQINYPDGGQDKVDYYDTSNYSTLTRKITSSPSLNYTMTQIFDSLGRQSQTKITVPTTTCSGGYLYVDTTYDGNGRRYTVSNPDCTSTSSDDVKTTFYYDALNRATSVADQDGNSVGTQYTGNCVTMTDEASKVRKSCADGLGRVTDVWEDPNGVNYHASYAYDPLGNLLSVLQNGSRSRTYSYDSLDHVLHQTEPETGTTCFGTKTGSTCNNDGYDSNGNLVYKTDPRGITTSYSYDELNRLKQKSYSDSTPTVKYVYDGNALPSGCSVGSFSYGSYPKLRRTAMCDGAGSEAWSYDSMGRALNDQRTTNSVTKTMSYSYNLDGSINTVTYPGNRVVTYGYNIAQQTISAQDNTNSINYAQSATYWPIGALDSVVYGNVSGGFAGITETRTYNSRLQVSSIQATYGSPTTTVLNLSYGYPSANNGNIQSQTNNVDSGRSQSYTYDSLNRLLTAQSQATSGADCWGQSFGNNATPPTLAADAWANMFYANSTQCSSFQPRFTPTTSNQFTGTGISYDADGNNTADTVSSYTYDAENHIITATGMSGGLYCYTYDGNGLRVAKSQAQSGYGCTDAVPHAPVVNMLYWRSIAGNTIAETDSTGSTSNANYHEYVFFNGRRVARSDVYSSSVYYYFADHLGNTRVMTQANGTVCFSADYYPYGQEIDFATTCNTTYKFTGYERDSETGLDYAFARYYNDRLGRFMSSDPLGGDPSDPQTLNRYSYVRDNPANLADPTGMCTSGVNSSTGAYIVCAQPINVTPTDSTLGGGAGGVNISDLGFLLLGLGPGYGVVTLAEIDDLRGRFDTKPKPQSQQVTKGYGLTTPCAMSASQTMGAVESNFARFGNYSRWGGLESVTFSPPTGMGVGSTIPINVGVAFANFSLSVTVQSMNSQSMTFTTNPGHMLYPASITFAHRLLRRVRSTSTSILEEQSRTQISSDLVEATSKMHSGTTSSAK